MSPREALELLLRRIDYNAGHCGPMMAISDLVPHYMLRIANESLEEPAELIDDDLVEEEVARVTYGTAIEAYSEAELKEAITGQPDPLDGQEQENETD